MIDRISSNFDIVNLHLDSLIDLMATIEGRSPIEL